MNVDRPKLTPENALKEVEKKNEERVGGYISTDRKILK